MDLNLREGLRDSTRNSPHRQQASTVGYGDEFGEHVHERRLVTTSSYPQICIGT
jgi:hypothetical protein